MKSFRIKTHRPLRTYSEPHFYILNKGLNSGKPMEAPCPNCFVCITTNENEREFMYWLCFGLWKSKTFHFYLKGSVIPFITIADLKNHLHECKIKAENDLRLFNQSIHALKSLEINQEKLKHTLKLIDTAKIAIFCKLLSKSTTS